MDALVMNTGTETSLTAALAAFAVGLTIDDIPAIGIDRARIAIADCIGCILAGVTTAPARTLLEVLRADGGTPAAAVFGTSAPPPRPGPRCAGQWLRRS